MKKNIIFLSLLWCTLPLHAMDNTNKPSRSLESIVGTFDESSDEELLPNKVANSSGKPVVVALNRNLHRTPKKKHSNATKIEALEKRLAEAEKKIALLEKIAGVKN